MESVAARAAFPAARWFRIALRMAAAAGAVR